MKIVMPSRGRAGKCLTIQFIPDVTIVCSESEKDAYRKAYPKNEILVEPKTVNNIVRCREWLVEMFRNEDDLFMIDDDVFDVRRFFAVDNTNEKAKVTSPEEVREIIENTCFIAKQLGSQLWGYNNAINPVQYSGHEPIQLTGYLNCSYIGFVKGHDMVFNRKIVEGEDHYISCMSIYKHRFHVRDCRWTFLTKENFKRDEGVQSYRNTAVMQKTTQYLQRLFGSNVVQSKRTTGIKEKLNEGERIVKFPF